jgi:decaprenylphospho-beta-D-erythro-pentofuranosid-2-ulose 2-reductase
MSTKNTTNVQKSDGWARRRPGWDAEPTRYPRRVIDALGNPQSVLVLGGTSEIGLAIVRQLRAGGRLQKIVLAGRDDAAVEREAKELAAGSSLDVGVEHFDAFDSAGHQQWVDELFDRAGPFDVVVLAFGVLGDQDEAERDNAEALRILQSNFVGAASVGLPVARRLQRAGHGVLVVMSSIAGRRSRRSNFVYGSSKAALDALAEGLDAMLDGSGARVMTVRPGFVHTRMTTGMTPAPFSTDAESVASAVADGLRRGSRVVYTPAILGPMFAVLRALPAPIFRRLPG